MMVDGTGRQVRDFYARRVDLGLSIHIREAQDRIRVGDVEIVTDERHAERRIEVFEEHGSRLRNPVTVGVPQKRDAVRAWDAGAGPFLRYVKEKAFYPFGVLRPGRTVGFGHEDVAIGKDVEPARVIEPGGKSVDREVRRRRRLRALRPTLGGGDIDGGDERGIGRRYRGIRTDAGLIGQLGGVTAGAE